MRLDEAAMSGSRSGGQGAAVTEFINTALLLATLSLTHTRRAARLHSQDSAVR